MRATLALIIRRQCGKSVQAFDELKVGDDVVARYTEAIAIAVRKP